MGVVNKDEQSTLTAEVQHIIPSTVKPTAAEIFSRLDHLYKNVFLGKISIYFICLWLDCFYCTILIKDAFYWQKWFSFKSGLAIVIKKLGDR